MTSLKGAMVRTHGWLVSVGSRKGDGGKGLGGEGTWTRCSRLSRWTGSNAGVQCVELEKGDRGSPLSGGVFVDKIAQTGVTSNESITVLNSEAKVERQKSW